jgi:hypothetical protein
MEAASVWGYAMADPLLLDDSAPGPIKAELANIRGILAAGGGLAFARIFCKTLHGGEPQ